VVGLFFDLEYDKPVARLVLNCEPTDQERVGCNRREKICYIITIPF